MYPCRLTFVCAIYAPSTTNGSANKNVDEVEAEVADDTPEEATNDIVPFIGGGDGTGSSVASSNEAFTGGGGIGSSPKKSNEAFTSIGMGSFTFVDGRVEIVGVKE